MSFEFDTSEIDELVKDLELIEEERPKKAKSFLKKEGTQLKWKIKREANKKLKTKTGNYLDGIKRGDPYKYQGRDLSIRAYNAAPHAHLIEYGHAITKEKGGKVLGFVKGKYVIEGALKDYQRLYYRHVDKFVDEVFNDRGFR